MGWLDGLYVIGGVVAVAVAAVGWSKAKKIFTNDQSNDPPASS